MADPTTNVLNLVSAAMRRQDDLRDAEFRRQDELRILSASCQEEKAQVENRWRDAAALAESRRIDALLAASTNNVALALEKQGAQAATLAAQVVASAQATTEQINTLRDTLDKRLTIVEQNQYQAGGRMAGQESSRARGVVTQTQLIAVVTALLAGLALLHSLHVI